jgi:nitroreductase
MILKKKLYRLYRKLVNIYDSLGQKVFAKISGKNLLLVKIYYFFFDPSFSREMQSVFKGKKEYLKRMHNQKANPFKLRREIHRIEKGLTTENRKDAFALSFILETVECYQNTYKELPKNNLEWAHNVLVVYFDVVDSQDANFIMAKKIFSKLKDEKVLKVGRVPFKNEDLPNLSISFDQFRNLCERRHSVRWFTKEKVPIDLISKAVKAGAESPSACNRQPFEVLYFDDDKMLKQLTKLPMGIKTYGHNIPGLALLVGDLSAYFDERDRHLIYIDASLFAMSFALALEAQGISTCFINWPDIETREKQLYELLDLPPNKRGIFFIAIGYAKEGGGIPYSEKKNTEEILFYNEKYINR